MTRRIGFACKYMHPDQTQKKKVLEELQRPLNEKATTITWLNNQTRDVAEQRLWDIMEHNGAAAKRLVEYVGGLPDELRMVRLGSNQLPAYTQHDWSYFWRKSDVRQEPNNFIQQWVRLHVSLMFACLCILGSLLCWQVITLIL